MLSLDHENQDSYTHPPVQPEMCLAFNNGLLSLKCLFKVVANEKTIWHANCTKQGIHPYCFHHDCKLIQNTITPPCWIVPQIHHLTKQNDIKL